MAALLDVEHLGKRFSGLQALDDVSLRVERGEIVGLMGPNGAGKTTLFNVVSGSLRPSSGRVLWRGEDVSRLPMYRIAALGLVRTYQAVRVFPSLTVFENILAGRHLHSPGGLFADVFGTGLARNGEQRARARAREILRLFGLDGVADAPARDLPYGLGKRLGVAIAFAADPELLMLDEPAAGLNSEETQALGALLRQVHAAGVTLWVIEHDVRFLMGLSQRVIVLDVGRTIAEGTPAEIRDNDLVRRVYLGAGFDRPDRLGHA